MWKLLLISDYKSRMPGAFWNTITAPPGRGYMSLHSNLSRKRRYWHLEQASKMLY